MCPAPSLTYTLTNGTTADASQVMQNYNDLLNGISDGTKDLSISALTCAGNVTLNGTTNTIGSASSDDLVVTASLASHIVPKTDSTYNIGSATLGLLSVYIGDGDAETARIMAAAHATSRTYSIPDCSANANFVMSAGTQTITGALTFSAATTFSNTIGVTGLGTFTAGVKVKDTGAGSTSLTWYEEGTFTPTALASTSGTASYTTQVGAFTRVGNVVSYTIHLSFTDGAGMVGAWTVGGLPYTSSSTANQRYSAAVSLQSGFTVSTNRLLGASIAANAAVIDMELYPINNTATAAVAANCAQFDAVSAIQLYITGHYYV